jgi:hypothetical protein
VRGAVNSLLVRDVREMAGNVSIDASREVWTGKAHSMMADFFERFRPKKAGFSRDRAGLRNLVREIMGESTGDADAATIAKQWRKTSDFLRQEFNKRGGDIRNLEDWALPQSHDAYAGPKACPQWTLARCGQHCLAAVRWLIVTAMVDTCTLRMLMAGWSTKNGLAHKTLPRPSQITLSVWRVMLPLWMF